MKVGNVAFRTRDARVKRSTAHILGDWNLRRFPHQELEKGLGCGSRRGRILPGDETAIDYRMALPILCFLVKADQIPTPYFMWVATGQCGDKI